MEDLRKEFQKNQAKIDSNKTPKEKRKELIERNKEIWEIIGSESKEKQTSIKIKDLKNDLYLGDYGEQMTEYDNGYIGDIITEIADNNVDIYTYDLFEWAKSNSYYINRAVDELGRPDTIEAEIRQGQFLAYQEDLYNNIEDILKYWAYNYTEDNYNITELTEEQNDEIDFLNYNNFDKLEDIVAALEDIFESEA